MASPVNKMVCLQVVDDNKARTSLGGADAMKLRAEASGLGGGNVAPALVASLQYESKSLPTAATPSSAAFGCLLVDGTAVGTVGISASSGPATARVILQRNALMACSHGNDG